MLVRYARASLASLDRARALSVGIRPAAVVQWHQQPRDRNSANVGPAQYPTLNILNQGNYG
jgi:hypothetical protein